MWLLLVMAAQASDVTLEAEALASMRPGVSVGATMRVARGFTVGASVVGVHDLYLGSTLDFQRRWNLRVGLLPSVGLVTRPGKGDRWDLHADLQLGPELLHSSVRIDNDRVEARGDHVGVRPVCNLKFGTRHRIRDRLGLGWSLTLPLAPGLAGLSAPVVERAALGVGLSWR